jgi:heme o synthase
VRVAGTAPEAPGHPKRVNVEANTAAVTATPRAAATAGIARTVGLYLELSKARLASLVVVTAAAGYALAARGQGTASELAAVLVGTALTAFGANALNQVLEIERDRRMRRTRSRPLPSGLLSLRRAVAFGSGSAGVGLVVLAVGSNLLTATLAAVVILLYLFAYTPLKVRTPLATAVGAVCGAIPPMMGWTAASGRLETGALILFGLLFLWQMPHFMALAWLYRDDYERGGFRMLPAVDPSGRATAAVALVHALALVPLAAAATASGLGGRVFLGGALALTLGFAALAWLMLRRRTAETARRLFLASLLYLPLVLGLMVADRDNRLRHQVATLAGPVAPATPGSGPPLG